MANRQHHSSSLAGQTGLSHATKAAATLASTPRQHHLHAATAASLRSNCSSPTPPSLPADLRYQLLDAGVQLWHSHRDERLLGVVIDDHSCCAGPLGIERLLQKEAVWRVVRNTMLRGRCPDAGGIDACLGYRAFSGSRGRLSRANAFAAFRGPGYGVAGRSMVPHPHASPAPPLAGCHAWAGRRGSRHTQAHCCPQTPAPPLGYLRTAGAPRWGADAQGGGARGAQTMQTVAAAQGPLEVKRAYLHTAGTQSRLQTQLGQGEEPHPSRPGGWRTSCPDAPAAASKLPATESGCRMRTEPFSTRNEAPTAETLAAQVSAVQASRGVCASSWRQQPGTWRTGERCQHHGTGRDCPAHEAWEGFFHSRGEIGLLPRPPTASR